MNTIDNYKQIVQDCFPSECDPSELIPYIEEHILSGNPKRFIWPADLSSIILSIYECYDIVGWTVDQLPHEQTVSASSLLLATTASLSSASIEVQQLSSQLLADAEAKMRKNGYLQTMAYADSNSFALSSHSHSKLYTEGLSVEYSKDIQRMLDSPEASALTSLGVLSVSTWSQPSSKPDQKAYQIWCPKVEVPSPALFEPAVGQLLLLPVADLQALHAPSSKLKTYGATGSMVNIDIHADDFNGWVFPNGTTFTCQPGEFAAAVEAFGDGQSKTSFTVPDLQTFFYGVTDKSMHQPLSVKDQQCIVGPHVHGVKIGKLQGHIELEGFQLSGVLVTSPSPGPSQITRDMAVAYFGRSSDLIEEILPDRQTRIAIDTDNLLDIDMQTAVSNQDSTPFEPQHLALPVMMYIGAKKPV